MKNEMVTEGELLILNSLVTPAAIMNHEGHILASNKTWRDPSFAINWLGIKQTGENYFEHCSRAVEEGNYYALKLIFAMREILDGKKKSAEININITTDKTFWCKIQVSKIAGSTIRVLIIFDDITSGMDAIHTLRETEERYFQNFQHSISGIIIGTPDGTIIEANPAACTMLGYTRKELVAGGRSLIINENDPLHIEMIRVRNETAIFEGQKVYLHKNGDSIPVEITSVQYTNNSGKPQILNTFRDITSEKKAHESLENERRFTQTVLNSVPGLFLVLDNEFNIIRWNQAMQFDLGYKETDLEAKNILEFFRSEDRKWNGKVLQQIIRTGKGNFITGVLSKANDIREYHFHINSFENSNDTYLVVTAVDITEFRESEKEREKNFNLLTQLFENSPLAMVMINEENIVQKVNDGFVSLFGYSERELLGKEVNSLISSHAELKEARKVSCEAFRGIANQQETIRLTKHQNEIPVIVSTVPVYYKDEVIAAYGIYVDLREQKELEKNLQNSLAEKNILLQEVHHRVKNNLAIIAGLLELQMLHENNGGVIKQLSEAHSRVFSIAKIHEALYQQNDLNNIRFEDYLVSIVQSKPGKENLCSIKLTVENDNQLTLNLNQAVPLSLVINELLHFHSLYTVSENPVFIKYICDKKWVNLEITGLSMPLSSDDTHSEREFSFKKLLIDTFVKQLYATIDYPVSNSDNLVIKFDRKKDIKGSSSSLSVDAYNKIKE